MNKLYKSLEKKANNIAKKDIIFLYPKKNKKLIKQIIREGDGINHDYQELVKQIKETNYICPEAEWIFDNFYLIQQKWIDLKLSFDKKNFLSLPQLGTGPLKEYPRVYNLITQLLSWSNNEVDSKQLIAFLNGYQQHTPLLISELNALPQIVTLEVILNFKKKIREVIEKTNQVNRADKMFKSLFTKNEGEIKSCLSFLAQEIKTTEIYYIERLWQRLEGDKIYHRVIKRWLYSYLRSKKANISFLLYDIKKKNHYSEEFFANTIDTLKLLPNINWSNLIEKISVVEKILQQDPAKAYQIMDEKGKALYQQKIQFIAKKFKVKEVAIARTTVNLALTNINNKPENHVGYFLIKKGYNNLEEAFRYQKTLKDKIKNFIIKTKTFWYFGSIFFFTILFSFLTIFFLPTLNYLFLIIIFLLSLEVSIILINHVILRIIPPNLPVRLFYKKIPKKEKTILVINGMLGSKKSIDSIVNNLKINYLNSVDQHIFYGILFDFKDSKTLEEKTDKELLNYAKLKINELNKNYCSKNNYKFFLFCRKRIWNPVERMFMGWERKRGKLTEFNKLLLGEKNTSFFTPKTCPFALRNTKYIITLDEDSIVPKETVKLLIGTLAHPLNQPIFNKNNEIISGYSIIQPHVNIRLFWAQSSLFSKIFSLPSVVDPHTHALSDIYQDLFGSGSYVGKGIYNLEAFSQSLENKIPENTVLSHDLLESCYAKAGLASDIIVFESFPIQFNVYFYRLHRWVRGDWQLINWLLPKIKNSFGKKEKNPLSFVDQWKIFDNLRRSLLSTVFTLGIIFSLYYQSFLIFYYTLLVLSLPFLLSIVSHLGKRHKGIPLFNVFFKFKKILLTGLTQIFHRLIFLIVHSYIEISAILHVFIRKLILKKKFLEWQTYQELMEKCKGSFWEICRIMIFPFFLSIIFLIYVIFSKNLFFYPFAILWLLSPLIGFIISQPINLTPKINNKELSLLRNWAVRFWTYYQLFVNEKTNFLPPDNIKDKEKIYYYTSPTNIGTYFLSMTSAWSLGYLTPSEFINRTSYCLETVKNLEKEKGHLYNWYNIKTLEPIGQKYLSSVDSGNFIASLFVLKEALKELENSPITKKIKEAIKDYLLIIKETALNIDQGKEIKKLIEEINNYLNQEHITKLPAIGVMLTEFEEKIPNENEELLFWIKLTKERIYNCIEKSSYDIDKVAIEKNINIINSIIKNINFPFLYNKERNLFQIGYNAVANKKDPAFYDLFGSESNIASFVSIALNQIEQIHWRKLNRTMINVDRKPILLSWGGSLFENINSLVFFKTMPNSLLQESGKKIIDTHIKYGKKFKIPWGMSEAAYLSSETDQEIHYRIFGVPEIGIKRDLAQYKVISPYSSFLSLSLSPKKAISNLLKLKKLGVFGRFGFYDSANFINKKSPLIASSYYAHHIGFSLAAICNLIKDDKIKNLFSKFSPAEATQYLLEELYVVDTKPSQLPKKESYNDFKSAETAGLPIKEFIPIHTKLPQSMFLSNGEISSVISNNGTSCLFNKNILLTPFSRFNNENQGWQIFLKDKNNNTKWSNTPLPSETFKFNGKEKPKYRVAFHENLAEFNTKYNNIETQTEITISPYENVEIRKITLTNHDNKIRQIQLETYGQALLADQEKELIAPYFHRLFLRSSVWLRKKAWIIKRSYLFPDDKNIKLIHWISSPEKRVHINFPENIEKKYLKQKTWFSESPEFGNIVDLKLKPNEKITLYCCCGFVPIQENYKNIIKKYDKNKYCQDIFKNIIQKENQYLQSLNINYAEAKEYRQLGSQIFWRDPKIASFKNLSETKKRDFLWQFGISGDLPIVVVSVKNIEELSLVNNFINAFSYLKFKGINFDLVLFSEEEKSYIEPLRDQIEGILQKENLRNNIYFISKNNLSEEDIVSLKNIAIGCFPLEPNNLINKKEQLNQNNTSCQCLKEKTEKEDLSFFNSYGGFAKEGQEYKIIVNKKNYPKSPWANIITNEKFGFATSQYGLGSTWYLNSQQNRITPWSFSPIKNQVSEFLYLKEKNCLWSLTFHPLANNNDYKIIHGKGFTQYENSNHNIQTTLKVFVHPEENCKFYQITIENQTSQEKECSFISYFPLALKDFPEKQTPLQIKKTNSDIFLAEQTIENNVGKTKAGIWTSAKINSYSFYQPNIFSRNTNLAIPNLEEAEEENQINSYPGLKILNELIIPANGKKDILILMTANESEEKIKETIEKFKNQNPKDILEKQNNFWNKTTSKIKIKTPSNELDIIFNNWLLYQTISSRLLAKTGTYQQGGAFGFRDQIQDLIPLIHVNPAKVREMLIYFASKQFKEGDVLNWWHEPEGAGARTLISDIHLWLPYVLSCYIKQTGDKSILEETAPYLEAELVSFDKKENWVGVPQITDYQESLYSHAVKALEKSFNFGRNKLPLMGTADWNDGLSAIGKKGKGESVWLSFFLYYIINQYIEIAENKKDDLFLKKLLKIKADLKKAIINSTWNGKWFIRAFHDDKTIIGTNKNKEYKIDLIVQSWSIITGIAKPEQEKKIIKAVMNLLYDKKNKIISLFAPAISLKSKINYGYIQGYPENVRENGAQYSHGALWFLEAATKAKEPEIVEDILKTVNPIGKSKTKETATRYQVEPYIIPADIWKEKNSPGQGGWTWYTASSGLFYRIILENVLGLKITNGNKLSLDPCIPNKWDECEIFYQYHKTNYKIKIINKSLTGFGVKSCTLNNKPISEKEISLIDDQQEKEIIITL